MFMWYVSFENEAFTNSHSKAAAPERKRFVNEGPWSSSVFTLAQRAFQNYLTSLFSNKAYDNAAGVRGSSVYLCQLGIRGAWLYRVLLLFWASRLISEKVGRWQSGSGPWVEVVYRRFLWECYGRFIKTTHS